MFDGFFQAPSKGGGLEILTFSDVYEFHQF